MIFSRSSFGLLRSIALRFIQFHSGISKLGRVRRRTISGWQWSVTPAAGSAWLLCWTEKTPAALDIVLRDNRVSFETSVSLGLFNLALVRLDDNEGNKIQSVEVSITPNEADAKVLLTSDGVISRAILGLILLLTRRVAPPLWIVRDLVVNIAGEATLRSGDVFPKDTAGHLAYTYDLTALIEARSPPLQIDQSQPLISLVVPVFNTSAVYLDDLLHSFHLQPAGLAELVLSDDSSTSQETRDWLDRSRTEPNVVVVLAERNGGIASATNAGIQRARGVWIGLVDHDDILTPFALSRVARSIAARPECVFLYTDEVISDERLQPLSYFHKPAFDIVLLSGVNYINHLSFYRRQRLLDIALLSPDREGSQDYDLVLRYTEGLPESVLLHLPYPAYIWRRSKNAYSARFMERATTSARKALTNRFVRSERAPQVDEALSPNLHRVRFDHMRTEWPKVSVVIPSIDAPELIGRILKGLTSETDYPAMEIVVIDNGTTDRNTLAIYAEYCQLDPSIRVVIEPSPFNFSAAVNKGLSLVDGDIVLLLNNDIEVLEPNWMKEMVAVFDYGGVGIVGAKLLYPDRKIQHVGVVVGFGGLAGHWHIGEHEMHPGAMGRLWVRQSLSAVTGACFAISRACLTDVGGFDEREFVMAYNDIDYCMRAGAVGYRVVWTPFATLIHHESATRGSDEALDKRARFDREKANLRRLHKTDRFIDPAINPWLSRSHASPFPIGRSDLPDARNWFSSDRGDL